MPDDALTFSQLRKIQKQEKRQEQLSDLDKNFLLRVSDYLGMKEDTDRREYRNAKRVFDKIIGLRQDKIVKNAKIAVKSNVKASELELLPREQELFFELKQMFRDYDDKLKDVLEKGAASIETNTEKEEEKEEDSEEESVEGPEDYEKVEIVAEVPEFMGTDLESYGPFEEGEKVEVPEENAEILVNRGNAERIEG